MASSDADPMTLVASLTRRNVRTALAFPLFELVAIALLARALHTPKYAIAIVAFLFGVAALFTARSAVAGMRVMELHEPGFATSRMRWMNRVNVGAGVLMMAYAVWLSAFT